MYYIIETQHQFDLFTQRDINKCFVELIFNHNLIHPSINNVSAVYIRPYNSKKGYMLCVSHNETFSLPFSQIKNLISSYDEVYVRDKKSSMYFLDPINLIHIPILLDLSKINELDFFIYNFFHRKYPDLTSVNQLIPLAKHYERCEQFFTHISPVFEVEKPKWFKFYNDSIELFHSIESNGLSVDLTLINDYFNINNEYHSLNDNVIYSQYNTDTTTKRPSNSFNGINFAALPKDESRKSFISKNGKLVDIDIDSYHPTLIAKQINYNFGDESIHEHLAKVYKVDYAKSKELTFKQLYGGVFKEYSHLEFFSKTSTLINTLWKQFNEDGFIECPISNYQFKSSDLSNMNPQKLFNYWIQNIETSQNILILTQIIPMLEGYNTKLILYTYDSFLFDVDKNESGLLDEICDVITNFGLKYKIKYGKNYFNLKKL